MGLPSNFVDLPRFLIDIRQQPASGFTVETNRGNQRVVLLNAPRPRFGIELNPVIPFLHRRTISEMAAVAFELILIQKSPAKLGCPRIGTALVSLPSRDMRLPLRFSDPTTNSTVRHTLPSHHETPFKISNPSKANTPAISAAFESGTPSQKRNNGKIPPSHYAAAPEPSSERSMRDQSRCISGIVGRVRHHEFRRHNQQMQNQTAIRSAPLRPP